MRINDLNFGTEKNSVDLNFYRYSSNQNFFNSLKFSNIDEFVNSFIKNESEDIDNESKNSEILKQNIKGNPVLNTVKPKLVSCSELSYLTKILKTKDNNLEVILFFKDNYYAEVLKKLEVESSFNKIFKNVFLYHGKGVRYVL